MVPGPVRTLSTRRIRTEGEETTNPSEKPPAKPHTQVTRHYRATVLSVRTLRSRQLSLVTMIRSNLTTDLFRHRGPSFIQRPDAVWREVCGGRWEEGFFAREHHHRSRDPTRPIHPSIPPIRQLQTRQKPQVSSGHSSRSAHGPIRRGAAPSGESPLQPAPHSCQGRPQDWWDCWWEAQEPYSLERSRVTPFEDDNLAEMGECTEIPHLKYGGWERPCGHKRDKSSFPLSGAPLFVSFSVSFNVVGVGPRDVSLTTSVIARRLSTTAGVSP
jgi:hypothetical protein